jgi:hypothetical protein
MAEAKSSKLKEYFTHTTEHTATLPRDVSGDKLLTDPTRFNSQNRETPIRMNDTYRSNFVLGSEESQFNAN